MSQQLLHDDFPSDEKFDDEFEEESHLSIFLKSLLCFGTLLVTTALACTFLANGNPTSVFFDARAAHADYSSVRLREAREFIHKASSTPQTKSTNRFRTPLCVVVTQSHRPGNHSYQNTIGSLLHGLSDVERQQIHLVVTQPFTFDTATQEPWLQNVVDSIRDTQLDIEVNFNVRFPETATGWTEADLEGTFVEGLDERYPQVGPQWLRQRPSVEYGAVIRSCRGVNPGSVLVLHDDMIVMDGWFHRTLAALGITQGPGQELRQVPSREETEVYSSVLYLRLFHNDSYRNWAFSSWTLRFALIFSTLMIEYTILLVVRNLFSQDAREGAIRLPTTTSEITTTSTTPSYLSRRMLFIYTFLYTPFFLAILFGCGKPSSLSLASGIHQLPTPINTSPYGLLFPSQSAGGFYRYLWEKETGSVEELLASYSEQHPEQVPWTVTPSMMQPVSPKPPGDYKSRAAIEERLRQEGRRTIAGRRRLAEISRESGKKSLVFETLKREDLEAEHLKALN